MRFSTGTKQINSDFFTVKRVKNVDFESNYNIERGFQIGFDKVNNLPIFFYHNVPANVVKIAENVYHKNGKYYGYRSE